MKRWKLYIILMLAYLYVIIKYSVLDLQSKFDGPAATFVVSIYYFIPLFLFTVSSYIILKASKERKWFVPGAGVVFRWILPIALTWLGYLVVRFQYDMLEPFISEYFLELNTGYLQPKAEDFRLEYLLFFVANIIAFFVFLDRKIQPLLSKKRDEGTIED